MMIHKSIMYAQVYSFLAEAFLYPQDNWMEDLPLLMEILKGLELQVDDLPVPARDLGSLQALHRQTLGLSGSLLYETEYGLPHEFRQSQELADIAGFYSAFGFKSGGRLRERPDHLSAELEFMYLLCLKEALALSNERSEEAQVCQDAQKSFLNDHLGSWIGLCTQALEMSVANSEHSMGLKNPYLFLAEIANQIVQAHAQRSGARPAVRSLSKIQPTPLGPEMSCGDCPLGAGNGNEESCL